MATFRRRMGPTSTRYTAGAWRAAWLAVLALAVVAFAACTPSPLRRLRAARTDAASVIAAEDVRFAATTARDTARLRAGLDPGLVYLHSNGLEESARDFVESVATGRIVYDGMERLRPTRVRLVGDVALADGEVRVSGRYEGTPYSVDLRYTSAYVWHGPAGWHLARWQSLKVE